MRKISLDPRMNRIELPADEQVVITDIKDSWITFEVFHQKKTGAQHIHAGIVHAPNEEMAMVFAKEQYSRRGTTTSLWVVKSAEILATDPEDADIFASTPEKMHREAGMYKTREKIEKFNAEKSGN